jgi:hypothetical protein
MTNKFTIEISAVDKATAVVKKVNDAMGKVTRPFEDAHKSFKNFGAAATKDSAVHVEVSLKNAPPGTTAKAKATGNATTSPPRVGFSAVGAAA